MKTSPDDRPGSARTARPHCGGKNVAMSMSTLQRDAAIVAQAARRISRAVDYDALIERAGEAQLVLIGEASHGTHEFYAARAELTKRLIDEKKASAPWRWKQTGRTAFACIAS